MYMSRQREATTTYPDYYRDEAHQSKVYKKPEMLVRHFLHARGFRFKLHDKTLPGKPDIVLPGYKTTIFIHDCFRHGHNWRYFVVPETRSKFWLNKINTNIANDTKAVKALKKDGWKIIHLWECELSLRKLKGPFFHY